MDERYTTHETPIVAQLKTRMAELSKKRGPRLRPVTISELAGVLGWGEREALRKALYRKLVTAYEQTPAPVSKIVWGCVARSRGKRDRGKWFCCVVIDELRRADLLPDE